MKEQPTAKDCRKGCIYLGSAHGEECCNYLLATGQMRGCPVGKDCTKYKRGKKRKKIWVED